MTDRRRATGAAGEQLAVQFLERHGYTIVVRNWRTTGGELDIIARDGAELVFVEVRTRRGMQRGSAEESVTPAKQRRLQQLAEAYLQQAEAAGEVYLAWRIDVVAIQIDGRGQAAINHLVHAVEG